MRFDFMKRFDPPPPPDKKNLDPRMNSPHCSQFHLGEKIPLAEVYIFLKYKTNITSNTNVLEILHKACFDISFC